MSILENYKKLIIALIVILVFFIIFALNNSSTSNKKSGFSLNKAQNVSKVIAIKEPIILTFTEPLDLTTMTIHIDPNSPYLTEYSDDNKAITIKPSKQWLTNTKYKITITKASASLNGKNLDKDYIFNFETGDVQK